MERKTNGIGEVADVDPASALQRSTRAVTVGLICLVLALLSWTGFFGFVIHSMASNEENDITGNGASMFQLDGARSAAALATNLGAAYLASGNRAAYARSLESAAELDGVLRQLRNTPERAFDDAAVEGCLAASRELGTFLHEIASARAGNSTATLQRLLELESRLAEAFSTALVQGRKTFDSDRKRLADGRREGHVLLLAAMVTAAVMCVGLAAFVFLAIRRLRAADEACRKAAERERDAQAEAARERRKLEEAFMVAPAAIAITRGPDHVFELVNGTYGKHAAGRDLIGKALRSAFPEVQNNRSLELRNLVYRTGKSASLKEFRRQDELWCVAEPGEAMGVYFDITYFPLRDKTGKVEGVLSYAQDITQMVLSRKKLEILADDFRTTLEKTRAAEQRLRTVINNAPIILWATDRNARITTLEGRGLKALGSTLPAAVGSSFYDLATDPAAARLLHETLSGTPSNATFSIAGRWFEASSLPLRDERGEISGTIGVSYDVTSKIRADQLAISERSALEASRLKSEFLANMSHEIRTPINGVIGMTTLLLGTELSAEQNECGEAIRSSAESLLSLVNGILDFSKIEAGRMEMETTAFSATELFRELLQPFAFEAARKGISLELRDGLPSGSCYVGDPGRLRQVASNLLSNALKFTARGGSVQAWIRELEREGERARIEVRIQDSGVGIAPEVLRKLFQPFVQADSSTTRRYGGTGLGLSICKRLVELMGGSIDAESTPGAGSVFRFTLSLPLSGKEPVFRGGGLFPADSAEAAARGGSLQGMRVLVAEDNEVNQKVAVRTLERLGCVPRVAGNGLEVLALLATEVFDVVLMDCQMPELDGYETTRRIRGMSSASFCSIPIIAVTANAVKGDREACLAAGMNDYLSKPVRPHEMSAAILHWVKASQRGGKQAFAGLADRIQETPSKALEAQKPTQPDFDESRLRELADFGGLSLLDDLIQSYRTSVRERMFELRTGLMSGDGAAIARSAHSFRSSGSAIGAVSLAALLAEIEGLCKDDPSVLQKRMEALQAFAVHSLEAVVAVRDGIAASGGGSVLRRSA